MANNSNLGAAKAAKNDEFYTQYADIQKEIGQKEINKANDCKRSL